MNRIKLIVLDVDGVLTNGSLYIGSDKTEYKQFNAQDGMGISLAQHAGILTAIISGRSSESVNKRAEELNINFIYQGIRKKIDIFNQLLSTLGLNKDEVCYMGDDINDLPIIDIIDMSFAPANAAELVKERVKYVTKNNGGNGAVREMIEIILKGQTDIYQLVNDYNYKENDS
ncbi:3-deoxy-D-manno-octulosonate 8-phosphate phosphatase [Sporosarcina globispora]|uniref:3-deoxy-D-manno-octulosonate 8-phosphate phosphatase n=1 Tax=Sporosarcina globispora TaxID=1459 RepID=A0A0M0GEW0_SPOGL|nr:HAD-IIIA family hydrolase [Sporosarcina globispora]KON88328.1 3-deoxy-D-manno-octulosonate 8-phosphate phosphatase [Sporosarcina globispora]